MSNRVKMLATGLLVVLAGASCSLQRGPDKETLRSKEAVLKYVESGYIKGYGTERLFCDRFPFERVSRTQVLLDYVGHGDFNWDCFKVSSDQRSMRFWQRSNRFLHIPATRVLVLGRDVMPTLSECPDSNGWVTRDSDNRPVVRHRLEDPRDQYTFANGQTRYFPGGIRLDNAGEFFCSGGRYWDYESETMKQVPHYIYSAHDPSMPLAESELPFTPEVIFVTGERLYLAGVDYHREGIAEWMVGRMPDNLVCEIYSRRDDGLTLMRRFKVPCPLHFAAISLRPIDFDEEADVMLLMLFKMVPWPLEYYVLDMESGRCCKVERLVCEQPRFIDPELIRGIIENTPVMPKVPK
jgi:hypothetical protein